MPMEAQANTTNNKQLLAQLLNSLGPAGSVAEYNIDAAQRTILFWDTLRQRGNQYCEHAERSAPHVLNYDFELVLDGRTFERPVNYALVRIIPPNNISIDPKLRPFVVVDPRAGHGPGIGGFKSDSEIGVAMNAGHPCYFVGFLPEPVPGQTIEDIAVAETRFLEKVGELHLDADGKPCVIGNCQAGWAVMMVAAMRPELFGPLIIAGSPLSYWAGERGKNPMRYTGGLLGGSWMTALLADLGGGKFDGAWLVQNFENLNPANTLWAKQYKLYSKIDSEAPRYLAFERWWGGHVNLNAEEIQSIVDELFVGNNLAAGRITSRDGVAIDLRNIHSPIVVFCSKGDNITPPQQALGWIADLYDSVDEMRGYGQTIVYSIHETTGHLGIFVSGGVARKEHGEFSSNIDLIDTLPPGLYEAVFTPKDEEARDPGLVTGDWIMRCEERTIDDIRKLSDSADEKLFAAAANISQSNLSLYRTFVQPWVRAVAAPVTARWMHDLHPLRLQYTLFSDRNPLMAPVQRAAQQVVEERTRAADDNFLLRLQEMASAQIIAGLDSWRDIRDAWAERTFRWIYGSPMIQAAAGIDPAGAGRIKKAAKTTLHDQLRHMRIAELKSHTKQGGLREATVRALIYAGLPRRSLDERGFEMMRRIRGAYAKSLSLAEFKSLVRAQFLILLLDEKRAMAAIPAMLPPELEVRAEALGVIRQVLNASGVMAGETERRFDEISQLFGVAGEKSPVPASDMHARAS